QRRCADKRGKQQERNLHARNFVMIGGAIRGCKCTTDRSNTNRIARLLNKSVAARPATHPENMRRLNFWIELDVIAAAAPDITRVAQQIVHLIDIALHLPELINRHVDEG